MNSYQDINPTATRSADEEVSSVDRPSPALTAAEIAQWKDESDRFLDDVERRLNAILAEVTQGSAETRSRPLQTNVRESPEAPPAREQSAVTDASEEDRFSALKAQLARKLHKFEESNDYSADDDTGREVQR